MLFRSVALMSAVLLAAAGCAPEGGIGEESEDIDEVTDALGQATIVFDGTWNENVHGVLAEDGYLTISYDDTRLKECRATQGGVPQYAVTAHIKMADGSETATTVAGLNATQASSRVQLKGTGDIEIWFEASNKYGCHVWDSNFGDNYRFRVVEEPTKPDWMGKAAFVVSRATCSDGNACDNDRRDLAGGVSYDTWARQRAAIRSIFFDVWEPGVTDKDNPNLWTQLDAQVHYRWEGQESFQTEYVNFSKRVGNDARYELPLRPLDPMHGNVISDPATQCPVGKLSLSPDGFYVRTSVELYFTVNGKELRPSAGNTYRVTFEDYKERYQPCL